MRTRQVTGEENMLPSEELPGIHYFYDQSRQCLLIITFNLVRWQSVDTSNRGCSGDWSP